jgi:hypothetical protein
VEQLLHTSSEDMKEQLQRFTAVAPSTAQPGTQLMEVSAGQFPKQKE